MIQKFFRSEALEAHNRFDRLPALMRVTRGWTRWTVAGLFVALSLFCAASVIVLVPIRVAGQGVLVDPSGQLLVALNAQASGYVRFSVAPGETVKAGQRLASLRLPERDAALAKLRRTVNEAKRQLDETRKLQAREAAAERALSRRQRSDLEKRIADLTVRVADLKQRRDDEEALFRKGLARRDKAVEARAALARAEESLADARTSLTEIDKSLLDNNAKRERELLEKRLALAAAVSERDAAIAQHDAVRFLHSPISGSVAELTAAPNTLISAGQTVVNVLSKSTRGVEAIVYVPLRDGKRVQPGDVVLIKPGSLLAGSRNRVRGAVLSVSDAPVTTAAVQRALGDDALTHLTEAKTPPFAVRVRLLKDKSGQSSYAWTSGHGPDLRLSPGTPVSADITIERRPLVVLVMPALRTWLGLKSDAWAGDPT
ncbi:MAG: NHLP bacteriocin system secretion protein [Pseudomonadota bacterium]